MTENTHTPGPWALEIDDEDPEALIVGNKGNGEIFSDGFGTIASVNLFRDAPGEDVPYPAYVANARLIAAAPDLLEALQAMLFASSLQAHASTKLEAEMKAHAALAKAKGLSR